MPQVGLLIFPFCTAHLIVWAPHFGWTPRLNYTVIAYSYGALLKLILKTAAPAGTHQQSVKV